MLVQEKQRKQVKNQKQFSNIMGGIIHKMSKRGNIKRRK